MLKDASHQQVMQKFSFIESLNRSRPRRSKLQLNEDQLLVNRDGQTPTSSTSNLAVKTKPESQASAIVNTAEMASTINPDWYQGETSNFGLNWAEVINAAVDHQDSRHQSRNRNYLGKILFALATSYCLFIVWWIFGHQGSKILTLLSGGKQVVLSQAEVQFIDYIERSLAQIDRQLEAKRAAAQNNDVVYVPVYTPAPATPSTPTLAGGNLSATPPLSNPSPAPSPALKIPPPPPLPAPVPLEENTTSGSQTVTAKPKIKHTLIGVLELAPNRSAALVQIQGKTRRIWVGEAINTEGWILESVGNQRATVNAHGQIRSIAVGETF